MDESKTLIDLEKQFWQSMVDQNTDVALGLLDEPALMVSTHGAMQFGHHEYRKMAEQGTMIVKSFELSDMKVLFPSEDVGILMYGVKQVVAPREKGEAMTQQMQDSSVWVRKAGKWLCVMHTETPKAQQQKK
jgi:hypothetical protein